MHMLWDIGIVGSWYWYAKLSSVLKVKQLIECMFVSNVWWIKWCRG